MCRYFEDYWTQVVVALIPEDLNIIVTPPPIRGGEYKVQIMNKVLAEAQFTVGSLGLRSIQQLFP